MRLLPFVSLCTACSAPFGYTLATGMDVAGNDIACNPLGTNSTGDLAKICQTTSGCVAFNVFLTTDGTIKSCLKNARTPLSDQSTTYMKGACQGIFYTGAHNAVACLGCTGGIWLAMCLRRMECFLSERRPRAPAEGRWLCAVPLACS